MLLNDKYKFECNFRILSDVFTPKFVEIKSKSTVENISLLKMANIKFPFLCKPLIAQGSSDAHKVNIFQLSYITYVNKFLLNT